MIDLYVCFQDMMEGSPLENTVDVHETAFDVHETAFDFHETAFDVHETAFDVHETAVDVNDIVVNESETFGGNLARRGTKSTAKEKLKPKRTEPMSSYACFVQEVKKKVGKNKLNMTTVNLKWKTMDNIQKDHYRELSRLDKLSLGDNYRKRSVRGLKRIKKEVKKREKKLVVKHVESETNPVGTVHSVRGLLEKVKDMDKEMASRLCIKEEQYQKLLKLKIDAEVKIRELGDVDSLIMSYQKKCEALIKKNRMI